MFLRFAIEVRKGGKVGAALLREVNVFAGIFGVEGAADQPAPSERMECSSSMM